jgi:hypothetical protein
MAFATVSGVRLFYRSVCEREGGKLTSFTGKSYTPSAAPGPCRPRRCVGNRFLRELVLPLRGAHAGWHTQCWQNPLRWRHASKSSERGEPPDREDS